MKKPSKRGQKQWDGGYLLNIHYNFYSLNDIMPWIYNLHYSNQRLHSKPISAIVYDIFLTNL